MHFKKVKTDGILYKLTLKVKTTHAGADPEGFQ